MRRGQKQFLGLINSSAILRQCQKKSLRRIDPYTQGEVSGYYCDLADYGVARKLFVEGNLLQHDNVLPSGAIQLYEAIRKMLRERSGKEQVKTTELTFIRADLRGLTDLGNEAVKKYLRMLVEYECLQITGGKRHGTRFCYRLREDRPIDEVDIAKIIPEASEMRSLIENDEELKIYHEYILVEELEF
jgi:hypothetical protein